MHAHSLSISSLTIRFTPGSLGTKTVTVSIASSLADSRNPFT